MVFKLQEWCYPMTDINDLTHTLSRVIFSLSSDNIAWSNLRRASISRSRLMLMTDINDLTHTLSRVIFSLSSDNIAWSNLRRASISRGRLMLMTDINYLTHTLSRVIFSLSSGNIAWSNLRRASISRGRLMLNQSPCPKHPIDPSPHVRTIPLSLENTLNPSPQHALQPSQQWLWLHLEVPPSHISISKSSNKTVMVLKGIFYSGRKNNKIC